MPKNVNDVLCELASVWEYLSDESRRCIADMIAGAMAEHHPVCNGCGKPLDEWDMQEDFHIHTTVGYGSEHDMEEVDLRLCCNCFDKLVDSCTVSPVKG